MGEVLRECHVTKLVLFTRLGDFLVYFSLVEYVFFYNDVYELEYLKKIYEIIYMFNHNWCIFIKMFGHRYGGHLRISHVIGDYTNLLVFKESVRIFFYSIFDYLC